MSDSPKFSESYWQEHYQFASKPPASLTISPYLSEIVDLPPGKALDAGCGEGLDAIWLSKQGWEVTAVDISAIALERAKELARAFDVQVEFEQADITSWSPQKEQYELVLSQYVHTTDNQKFIKALVDAVKPGGTLLIVGHHPPTGHDVSHHEEGSHLRVDEIAVQLDSVAWEVQIAEVRTSQRGTPDGETVVLRDSLLKAHKRIFGKKLLE